MLPTTVRALQFIDTLRPRGELEYRELARCLWPNSLVWKKRSGQGVTGATMSWSAAGFVEQLRRKELVRIYKSARGPPQAFLTMSGRRLVREAVRGARLKKKARALAH